MTAGAIELRTGVTIEFAEQGDRSGTPLLLLPGLGDSWHSFKPVLEHLPDSIQAFALTLRGHGDSTHPSEGYGFRHFAADIEGFMDALALPAAVVAAHSASGFFAQRLALDHPRRVLGLVFVASPLTLRHHAGLREAWSSTFSRLTDPIDPSFVRDMQASTLAKPVPQEFFEKLVAEAVKVPAHVWKQAFGYLLEEDLVVELGKIDAPTVMVWGDRDAILSRADQDALVAAIKGARLVVYPGAGHSPHWEEPSRFASDLARFVESVAGKAGPPR